MQKLFLQIACRGFSFSYFLNILFSNRTISQTGSKIVIWQFYKLPYRGRAWRPWFLYQTVILYWQWPNQWGARALSGDQTHSLLTRSRPSTNRATEPPCKEERSMHGIKAYKQFIGLKHKSTVFNLTKHSMSQHISLISHLLKSH